MDHHPSNLNNSVIDIYLDPEQRKTLHPTLMTIYVATHHSLTERKLKGASALLKLSAKSLRRSMRYVGAEVSRNDAAYLLTSSSDFVYCFVYCYLRYGANHHPQLRSQLTTHILWLVVSDSMVHKCLCRKRWGENLNQSFVQIREICVSTSATPLVLLQVQFAPSATVNNWIPSAFGNLVLREVVY